MFSVLVKHQCTFLSCPKFLYIFIYALISAFLVVEIEISDGEMISAAVLTSSFHLLVPTFIHYRQFYLLNYTNNQGWI
jgi:hypothetical protein